MASGMNSRSSVFLATSFEGDALLLEQPVERCVGQPPASDDDAGRPVEMLDAFERIAIEEDQIGTGATTHHSPGVFEPEIPRRAVVPVWSASNGLSPASTSAASSSWME